MQNANKGVLPMIKGGSLIPRNLIMRGIGKDKQQGAGTSDKEVCSSMAYSTYGDH